MTTTTTEQALIRISGSSPRNELGTIPEVANFKPAGGASLQQFDGTNVCQWHVRNGAGWQAVGPLFAIAATQSAQEPEGWKLVPIDPTPEMLAAAYNTGVLGHQLVYPAMIAAAPAAQAAQQAREPQSKGELTDDQILELAIRHIELFFDDQLLDFARALLSAQPTAQDSDTDFYRGVIAALGALRPHSVHGGTLHDEIVASVGKEQLYTVAEPEDVEWAGLDPEFYAAIAQGEKK